MESFLDFACVKFIHFGKCKMQTKVEILLSAKIVEEFIICNQI
jgi:hypothetical protein